MTLYRLIVERTIKATVEIEADDLFNAEIMAEDRANKGDYDDIFDDLVVDAHHATYGVKVVES